jgi:hypothetical protein
MHQVTIHVTITDSTPRAVINDADDHPGQSTPEPGRQVSFPDFGPSPYKPENYHDHELTGGRCRMRAVEVPDD